MIFEGKIVKVTKKHTVFLVSNYEYFIPNADVYCLIFEDPNSPLLNDLIEKGDELSNPEKCFKAQMDVEAYHGKAFGNFCLGFFFGVFGLIGCAVSSPGPQRGSKTLMMSSNKELFNDPAYLSCYKKKARGKAIGNSLLGWGASILLIIALSS